jgi:hypothetical protein
MPKLVLLFLLVTAAALGIELLFQQETDFPVLLSTFFADASLGLIAGFGSRIVLSNRSLLSRLLVAITAAILGMILLGSLTHWKFGIGPFELDPKVGDQIRQIRFDENIVDQIQAMTIDARTLLRFRKMDWTDLSHLTISMTLAVMSLQAWPQFAPQSVEVVPLPAPRTSTRSRRRTTNSSTSGLRSRLQLPGNLFPQPGSGSRPRARTRSRNGNRSTVLKEAKDFETQAARPKRRSSSRRKPQIQFALVEEHRCPYCLDAVTHNDPRGVQECEVCHTLHHADCWSITGGTCQVPHLNT